MKRNIMLHKDNQYYCMFCGSTFTHLPKNNECPKCHTKNLKYASIEISNPHFQCIIKISDDLTIEKIREGSLWFKSPKEFHDYAGAGKSVREDQNDSKFCFIEKDNQIEDINIDTYRILCFYSLDIDEKMNFQQKPDIRVKEFGNYYSIVDIKALFEFIKEDIVKKSNRINLFARGVSYLLDNYTGPYTPFCKFQKDGFQNEFRIVLQSEEFRELGEKPYKINSYVKNFHEFFTKPKSIENLFALDNYDNLFSISIK